MKDLARTALLAATLGLSLSGCSSMPDVPDIDPTDWFAGDWFGTKKPLPGERKELFPGGVPGVSRGVPPDLIKGNQAAAAEDAAPEPAVVLEEPKPKPKPKVKPRPKVVAAKPAPVAPASRPSSVTVQRAEQPPPQQQQQSGGVQWPEPPPPVQQRQGPAAVQWPDPPPPPR